MESTPAWTENKHQDALKPQASLYFMFEGTFTKAQYIRIQKEEVLHKQQLMQYFLFLLFIRVIFEGTFTNAQYRRIQTEEILHK